MENVRKHRDIKLITTGKKRRRLASETNKMASHNKMVFSGLVSNRNEKNKSKI